MILLFYIFKYLFIHLIDIIFSDLLDIIFSEFKGNRLLNVIFILISDRFIILYKKILQVI